MKAQTCEKPFGSRFRTGPGLFAHALSAAQGRAELAARFGVRFDPVPRV